LYLLGFRAAHRLPVAPGGRGRVSGSAGGRRAACAASGPSMRTPFAAARLLVLLVVICSLPLGCAAGNAGRIEEAVRRAEPGAIIYIPPGTYRVADLEIPPEVTLYAPSGATLVGNLVVRGPGTVIRGLTFDGGSIDISESRAVTIGDCAFRGGETAIRLDGATEALIINNDFRGVSGGVITGWGL